LNKNESFYYLFKFPDFKSFWRAERRLQQWAKLLQNAILNGRKLRAERKKQKVANSTRRKKNKKNLLSQHTYVQLPSTGRCNGEGYLCYLRRGRVGEEEADSCGNDRPPPPSPPPTLLRCVVLDLESVIALLLPGLGGCARETDDPLEPTSATEIGIF